MSKERRKIMVAVMLSLVLVSGLCLLVFRTQEQPEPVYEGKRLSEWLHQYYDPWIAQPVGQTRKADQAISQIGTNAIPTLLRMLRTRDSNLKLKLVGLAQKQHLIKINFVAAEQRYSEAFSAFRKLGASASNAVPALIQIFEERISDASQMAAANSLGCIGPASRVAVPAFLRTVADTNASAQVRSSAALWLGGMHAEPELVVPVLTTRLKDPHPDIRGYAAFGLSCFGNDAKAAVPALVDLLKDPVPGVKEKAEEALKAIDPEAAARAGVK